MNYWIIVDEHHDGPYSGQELVDNGLTPETLVWTQGLADWTPAGEIAELAALLEHRSPYVGGEPVGDSETAVRQQSESAACNTAIADEGAAVEPASQAGEAAAGISHADTGVATNAGLEAASEPTVQPQIRTIVAEPVEPCPPAYIAWSIIVTLLCCTIAGIPAIVFASMTKSAYYRGDIAKSKRYSELAQWFIIASIVLGAVSWPFQMAFMGML